MNVLKLHVSLNVSNVDAAVASYEKAFGVQATKHRPDYAKFDLEAPSLDLTMWEAPRTGTNASHFGAQVVSSEDVAAAWAHFKAVSLKTMTEDGTSCSHALQDKVWIEDPDGNAWEVFAVKGEAAVMGEAPVLEAKTKGGGRLRAQGARERRGREDWGLLRIARRPPAPLPRSSGRRRKGAPALSCPGSRSRPWAATLGRRSARTLGSSACEGGSCRSASGLMAAGVFVIARTILTHWPQAALRAVAGAVSRTWLNPASSCSWPAPPAPSCSREASAELCAPFTLTGLLAGRPTAS
jgi:catechol 2,3-dioxygenase-like lactoylglutathione lyase family enzyme